MWWEICQNNIHFIYIHRRNQFAVNTSLRSHKNNFYEDIIDRCKAELDENEDNRFLKRFRFHFVYFYGLIKKEAERNGIKPSIKKLVDDNEYLKKFTNPIFERIVERIINLFYDEVDKDKYQNAPIRDLTMSLKHLEKLESKIMSRLPKFNLDK